MDIGILGSGIVGKTIGSALAQAGHRVKIGTRQPDKLADWLQSAGDNASVGTAAEAARFGEVVINATSGSGSIAALESAGAEHLDGKIIIDISNPLDFSQGMPPSLFVCNTDSLGEQIQRAFPDAKVVKTLNTLTASLMVNPGKLAGGDHHIFVSGNDAEAKRSVQNYLRDWFGWQEVIDLGDITTARGTEMLLPVWLRLWGAIGSANFNFKIVK